MLLGVSFLPCVENANQAESPDWVKVVAEKAGMNSPDPFFYSCESLRALVPATISRVASAGSRRRSMTYGDWRFSPRRPFYSFRPRHLAPRSGFPAKILN
jgi:hypothetical protein